MHRSRFPLPGRAPAWLAMTRPWRGRTSRPPQAVVTFDRALNSRAGRVVASRPPVLLVLSPSFAPLFIRNFAIRRRQNPVTPLPVNWALAVFCDPKAIRVYIGAAVGNEPNAVLIDEVVRHLGPIGEVMDVLHAVDEEGKGITGVRINLSQVKNRL